MKGKSCHTSPTEVVPLLLGELNIIHMVKLFLLFKTWNLVSLFCFWHLSHNTFLWLGTGNVEFRDLCAENPGISEVHTVKSGVGKIIALCASLTDRNFTFLIFTFLVHSASCFANPLQTQTCMCYGQLIKTFTCDWTHFFWPTDCVFTGMILIWIWSNAKRQFEFHVKLWYECFHSCAWQPNCIFFFW